MPDDSDDNDDDDFSSLLPGVRRLRSDRVNIYAGRKPESAKPRPPVREDEPLPTDFAPVTAPGGDAGFSPGLQKKLQRRIRLGQIRPEASLDLHGYRQREALQLLESFLDHALQRGLRMIVVIHGQGLRSSQEAVLKPLVKSWLGSQHRVLAWCPAQARDGGAGASYVYLKND